MTCRTFQDLFSDHLEGGLSRVQAAAVDEHLAACTTCRTLHAAMAALLRELPVLAGLDRAEPPPRLADRVIAAVSLPRVVVPFTPRRALEQRGRVRRLAARRAAGWALVFAGVLWQLAGATVTEAATDALPAAERLVVEARQHAVGKAARREGPIGVVAAAADGLRSAGRRLNEHLYPEPPRSASGSRTRSTP